MQKTMKAYEKLTDKQEFALLYQQKKSEDAVRFWDF